MARQLIADTKALENVKEDVKDKSLDVYPNPATSYFVVYDYSGDQGRSIELIQKHRAEEDLAVAAASILARDEFVTRLGRLEKEYGMAFPKGASAAVDAAAKEFVAKQGAENLPKVAKTHFRTALRAQGLPEPPKVEWKRR